MLSRLMTRKEQLLLVLLSVSILLGAIALYLNDRRSPQTSDPVVVEPTSSPQQHAAVPPSPPAIVITPDNTVQAPQPVPTPTVPSTISVAVAGAVQEPGVYEFDEGARVEDLLNKAGGILGTADLTDINRAARLIDATTLTVPTLPSTESERGTLVLRGDPPVAVPNPPSYTISGWKESAPASLPPTGATPLGVPAARDTVSGLINVNTADAQALDSLPGIGPKLAEEIIRYRGNTPFASVDDLENVPGIGPKKLESIRALVTVQ